ISSGCWVSRGGRSGLQSGVISGLIGWRASGVGGSGSGLCFTGFVVRSRKALMHIMQHGDEDGTSSDEELGE
ncbi:hypothetical protein Tco_0645932, partial [Tanacetum coccineum]